MRIPHIAASILLGVAIMICPANAQSGAGNVAIVQDDADNPFAALVGRKRARRESAERRSSIDRFVLAADNRALLFEDRSSHARVQFLCAPGDQRLDCQIDETNPAPEIYRVEATRGPRGDVIYKNIHGDVFMRIASYGGATVFWPGYANGAAASKSFGDDETLTLPTTSLDTVVDRARSATAMVSASTGAPIVFEVGVARSDGSGNFGVLADAIVRTAAGIQSVAKDQTGSRIVSARISKVQFVQSEASGLKWDGNILRVSYVPNSDIDGRPSSAAVAKFLENTL